MSRVTETVYRGEHGEEDEFIHSRLACYYFSDAEVASFYAMQPNFESDVAILPRVYPVKLTMKNPFIYQPRDPYIELSEVVDKLGADEAKRIALKFSTWIVVTDNWLSKVNEINAYKDVGDFLTQHPDGFSDLYFQAWPFFQDKFEVEGLILAGFDGAVHQGSNISSASIEYCVFHKHQIKSIFEV